MAKFLNNKVALVTGSTSGIGLAIAEGLACHGCHIVLNGFGDQEIMTALQERLQQDYGVDVFYSAANLLIADEIRRMFKEVERKFQRIDILVNNAGIQYVAPLEEFPEAEWERIIALNLTAAFHTTKAVIPLMVKQGWGRVVNIASAHGLVASPFKSAYVAAKHGLVGFTKSIALEVAEKNITVNALCPGYVRTPLVDRQIAAQALVHKIPEEQVVREIILKTHPNKKFVNVQHLAELTSFLCSDMGESMTGEIISIDGGWTAQ